jgi:hypothetical protein
MITARQLRSHRSGNALGTTARIRSLERSPAGVSRKEAIMPLFMDVHNQLPEGASAKDVAAAHAADVKIQDQYNVRYLNYWVDDKAGKVFCLVDAPDADAAHTVHREAHGLVADEIYPVEQG